MRKLLGTGAVLLGVVGVLLCATAVGIGWRVAVRATARLDRIAARLDHGLSEADLLLSRVEARLDAVRSDLNTVRGAADTISAAHPELPRVRAEIERLLDRLVPTFERADALADSLQLGALGLRTAAVMVDQFNDDPEATVRVRNAADRIDRAAETLHGLRARIEATNAARAVVVTREIVALAREAIAGSELLAEGLAAARQEIAVVRPRMAEWRDDLVSWVRVAATASTLVWLWVALGQLCLIGWGRRRFGARQQPITSG